MTVRQQLPSFAAVGMVGLVVDIGVLYAVAPMLGWWVGRVVSFLAAASTTWVLNRRFTFAQAPRPWSSPFTQYLRYLAAMLAGAAVNYSVYAAVLLLAPSWPHAALIGVALGSSAGLAVNFASARLLVFNARNGEP